MRNLISWITLWGLVFCAGCQMDPIDAGAPLATISSPAVEPLATALPDSPTQGAATPMPPSLATPAASGLESLIQKAKQDLAQRLSIAVTQISLVQAEGVVWPDSSLGCPQPGMLYKQVPQDGALIILQGGGIVYEYHVGGSRGLFLCQKVYKDPDPPPQLDLNVLTPRPTLENSIPPGADS